MKNIVLFFSVLMLCVSCNEAALQKMRRADSIMNSNCDSALTILSGIDVSKLCTGYSRAYYALLFTEAKYKNFLPLGNDSLIDIAADYFSKKDNPQLYGRALMYKGCTLFEMTDYKGAITEYKKAEREFEKDSNYTMLGLINTRLGEIYEKTYAPDSLVIGKYKVAVNSFLKCNDSLRLAGIYQQIGTRLMFMPQNDSAVAYLEKSIELVPKDHIGNSICTSGHYLLMKALVYGNKLKEAKEIGLSQKALCDSDINNVLAEIYIRDNQQDSALALFNNYKKSWTELSKLIFLKKYHKSLGNYKEALFYEEAGNRYADSITDMRSRANLAALEHKFDYTQKELEMYKARSVAHKRLITVIILVFVFALAIVLAGYILMKKKKEIQEYMLFIEQLRLEKDSIAENLLRLQEENNRERSELYTLLGRRFADIQNMLNLSYQHLENPSTFVSKVKKELSSESNIDVLLDDLYKMVDRKNNGALSAIRSDYAQLSDTDLKIISLYSEDFSAVAIAFLFNTTPQNIHTRRYRLVKKLNITVPIGNFVREYTKHSV